MLTEGADSCYIVGIIILKAEDAPGRRWRLHAKSCSRGRHHCATQTSRLIIEEAVDKDSCCFLMMLLLCSSGLKCYLDVGVHLSVRQCKADAAAAVKIAAALK